MIVEAAAGGGTIAEAVARMRGRSAPATAEEDTEDDPEEWWPLYAYFEGSGTIGTMMWSCPERGRWEEEEEKVEDPFFEE